MSDQGVRLIVSLACLFAFMAAFVAVALGFAARRARVLDPGFARLGIAGRAFLLNVREYHGAWEGRAVDALYSRRGPMLETTVDARIHGTLAVMTRSTTGDVLRGALGLPTITLHDPAFAHLTVSAADGQWAAAVLATPAVRDGVLRALGDPSGREHRAFALRPGAVRLTRRGFDPDRAVDDIAPMVGLLASVGAAVEGLPAPAVPVALSDFERAARKAPGAVGARIAVAFVLGVVVLVAALTTAMMMMTPSVSRPTGDSVAPQGNTPTVEAPWGGRRRRR